MLQPTAGDKSGDDDVDILVKKNGQLTVKCRTEGQDPYEWPEN